MAERLRCFLAVDPADDVRRAILAERRALEAAGGDVRWTRPEGLHVTLQFLGDVDADRVAAVAEAAAAAVAGEAPFVMRARGVGGFPSLERPRVLWVGVEAPALARLAAALGAALAQLGFVADAAPFRPHLTFGRVRSMRGWPGLRDALRPLAARAFGDTRVERIGLYRSRLQPGGAEYGMLAGMALAGAEANGEGEANGHRR